MDRLSILSDGYFFCVGIFINKVKSQLLYKWLNTKIYESNIVKVDSSKFFKESYELI